MKRAHLRSGFWSLLPVLVWLFSGSALASAAAAVSPLQATPESAAETPAELNKKGSDFIGQNRYDEAKAVFERALALAREQNDVHQEAYALLGVGRAHYWKGEYAPAGSFLEEGLALFESISEGKGLADTLVALGSVNDRLGNPEKSLEYYRKALAYYEQVGDLRAKATVLLNISFNSTLPAEEGFDYLRQALEIAKQLGDARLQGYVLHNWGDGLTAEGRFAEANEKLEQAASLLEQAGDQNALARVFTSMGRLLRIHGQPEGAIEMYRRALEIQQEISDRQGIVQSYNAMGVAYTAMEDYRKAGECYQRALDLARETGSERIINFMEGALASNYLKLKEYARAADLFEQVISRGKDAALDFRYVGLANAYYHLGRYQDALAAVERALSLRRQSGQSFELHDSLAARAGILAKINRTEEALADVGEGMRLLEEQRRKTIPLDFLKRGYADSVQSYYSLAVDLLIQAGRAPEAVEVAEQGRARAFLDLLATREVTLRKESSAEVADLRALEAQLRTEGTDPAEFAAGNPPGLVTRGTSAPPPADSSLSKRWKSADLELRSFVAAEPFSAEQLAATAKRLHSTILSYWVGDEATYIWAVRADGTVQVAKSPISRGRLAELIGTAIADSRLLANRGDEAAPAENADSSALTTRGGMSLQLNPSSKQAWRQLYDALLRPIRDQLPKQSGSRLTIIPHGPLFRLSFAALLDERGRYLVARYELHYAPAGAVLEFTRKKLEAPQGADSYLLVADPANTPPGEENRKLPPLPGARSEVGDIIRLLPAGSATTLDGAAATRVRVRNALPTGRVIHFATHGIVRDDSPLDSFLALGTSSDSDAEDGRFTAQEIYGLELNADLVFLSACRSGRGKVTGDGVVGLTRSFVYAGTPSVVASLWDVADEPTRRLVLEFYRAYRQDARPGRALRAAQLRLLSDLRAGRIRVSTPAGPLTLPEDPRLWAAFIALGEP